MRIAINEAMQTSPLYNRILFEEVEYDRENKLCRLYQIYGIPTLLVFADQKMIEKYYGQMQKGDVEKILSDLILH